MVLKLSDLANDVDSKACIISGDVLNGSEISKSNHSLNYFDEILSVIKIDNKREFLGWLMRLDFEKYNIKYFFIKI